MARAKKSAGFSFRRFLFIAVAIFSAFLCMTGLAIAFVVCADHVSEFFNGWNYKNDWEPFRGNYLEYVMQIPREVYTAFYYFPEACFITLIFFPLFVLLIAFFEVMRFDYTIVTMGWLPFISGIALFVVVGFALLREDDNPNAGKYNKL